MWEVLDFFMGSYKCHMRLKALRTNNTLYIQSGEINILLKNNHIMIICWGKIEREWVSGAEWKQEILASPIFIFYPLLFVYHCTIWCPPTFTHYTKLNGGPHIFKDETQRLSWANGKKWKWDSKSKHLDTPEILRYWHFSELKIHEAIFSFVSKTDVTDSKPMSIGTHWILVKSTITMILQRLS